jgi:predicted enzyme related to lactoylglutathione lyase
MKRVTGIGGVFFNAKDPVALRAWYKQHLGIDVQEWGGTAFTWTDAGKPTKGTTVWSIGAADGESFAPSKSTFMVNYRVEDLAPVLQALRDEGCDVLEKTDDSGYGKFGWVMDPEGNKERPEFQRILPLDSRREVFDAAVRDGSIVSPWRAQGDHLYYIADDLRTTANA